MLTVSSLPAFSSASFTPSGIVAQAVAVALPPLSLTAEEEENQLDLPVESYEQTVTDRLELEQVLEELEPRDRALIRLRYLGRQTQQATADRLGMTQVQVSRFLGDRFSR